MKIATKLAYGFLISLSGHLGFWAGLFFEQSHHLTILYAAISGGAMFICMLFLICEILDGEKK